MITINKPNLEAPRFRSKRHNVLDDNFVKRFTEQHPQYKDLPINKFRDIIVSYNEALWKTAVDNRDGVELPEGLGHIFIGSCPSPKRDNIDIPSSLKAGVRLNHRNFESDNYLAKIFYTNFSAYSKYRFRNRQLWKFKGCRLFTRAASEGYRKDWKKYVIVDNLTLVCDLYKKKVNNQRIKLNEALSIPREYNEFDMD